MCVCVCVCVYIYIYKVRLLSGPRLPHCFSAGLRPQPAGKTRRGARRRNSPPRPPPVSTPSPPLVSSPTLPPVSSPSLPPV